MTEVDWITKEQLEIAKNQAEKILDEFCNYDDGDEKWWREIEIGEEFLILSAFKRNVKEQYIVLYILLSLLNAGLLDQQTGKIGYVYLQGRKANEQRFI